jgi:hypothetical protein
MTPFTIYYLVYREFMRITFSAYLITEIDKNSWSLSYLFIWKMEYTILKTMGLSKRNMLRVHLDLFSSAFQEEKGQGKEASCGIMQVSARASL